MKTTIYKTVLAVCIGFIIVPAFGQEVKESYLKEMDKIFSGIPVEKVTTGILIERAPSFVNMFRYEREFEEIMDTCNLHKWKQMVLQLGMAHLDSSKFNYNSSIVKTNYRKNTKIGSIPLGIIFYDYNRIDHEALNKGLLLIDTLNGIIRDVSRRNENPMKIATCFVASPVIDMLEEGTYSFYIEPSLFISKV
jgi:hypothetical protein